MNLNNARKIEIAIRVVVVITTLPFAIFVDVFGWLRKLLKLPIDGGEWVCQKCGNKLLRKSDAVKCGKIKNQYILRNCTARDVWEMFDQERKEEYK